MPYNRLIERQVKKHLTEGELQSERTQRFIQAVSDSYDEYERDLSLLNHAFAISEQDYTGINEKLKEEVTLRHSSIQKLKETIFTINPVESLLVNDSGDLSDVINFLEQELEEKKKADDLLQQSEKRLRLALQTIGDNVWEYNFETRTMTFAHTDKAILNVTQTEYSGDENLIWWKSIVEEDLPIAINTFRNYMSGDVTSHCIEYRVHTTDGKTIWVLNRGGLIKSKNGKPHTVIGTLTDIQQYKTVQHQLQIAKQEAENSAHAKELFLANMSHEIRTPMNAILGMSKQLQKTHLLPQQQKFLTIISTAAENLLVIINDILDFSKIEAGKINLEEIGFNVADLVHKTAHILNHKAEEKGLQLQVTVDERVAPVLKGDPYRITQIIMNLISNSIKFTKRGGVTINCSLIEETANWQQLQIMITDTGKGMDEAYLSKLFNKFSQEDESIARSYGGTGLGMSIVKQLIELMQGTIQVNSKKDEGTQVCIRLQLPIGNQADLQHKHSTNFDVNILAGKKILLVEDNEMNRMVAVTMLHQYAAEITEAVNGAMAIEIMEHNTFDLVLMDMQMPVMDGLEATQIIRNRISKWVPIIALTANAVKGEMEKCLKAGMNDYLSKPFEEEDLAQLIASWLGKENVPPTKTHPTEKKQEKEAPLYDIQLIRSIGRGDEQYVLKILQCFIKEASMSIHEMETALQAGDYQKIRFYAHRIKSSLNSLAVSSARGIAEKIETTHWAGTNHDELDNQLKELMHIVNKVIAALREEYDVLKVF